MKEKYLPVLYAAIIMIVFSYFTLWLGCTPVWLDEFVASHRELIGFMPVVWFAMAIFVSVFGGIICVEIHSFAITFFPSKQNEQAHN